MNEPLPTFRYHPDPVATGSVKASDAECVCCGRARGAIYTSSVYSTEELDDRICPWCIADGSAAEKFGATFCQGTESLYEAGVPEEVIDEVLQRTPGFESWQGEAWQACCGDPCEFHGDAPAEELRAVGAPALAAAFPEWGLNLDDWEDLVRHYRPPNDPALYKFVCRHCGKTRYGMDAS
jgi:uncharacterized protein